MNKMTTVSITPSFVNISTVSGEQIAHLSAASMTRVRHQSAMSSVMKRKCLHRRPPCCYRKMVREALRVYEVVVGKQANRRQLQTKWIGCRGRFIAPTADLSARWQSR